jgi:hypothetical protein
MIGWITPWRSSAAASSGEGEAIIACKPTTSWISAVTATLLLPSATGDNGWAMRLINRTVPYVWYAKFGDRATTMAPAQEWRATALDHMSSMVDALGINDVQQGATISQIVNAKLSLARQATVRRLPLYWATLTPVTTSTDLWQTTTNQTTNANNSVRVAFNDWLRAGAPIQLSGGQWVYAAIGTTGAVTIGNPLHPVWGYFDFANAVESSTDSGLWKPMAGRSVSDGAMSSTSSPLNLTSATANFTSN